MSKKDNKKFDRSRSKVIPIIQTRKMKEREKVMIEKKRNSQFQREIDSQNQDELNMLNQIDTLTNNEIVGGETVWQKDEQRNIPPSEYEEADNDGVELSIQGLDIDDMEDDFEEPGEILSSSEDESESTNKKVALKVVKISKTVHNEAVQSDKIDKFSHLHNDPEFRAFLKEMVEGQKQHDSKTMIMLIKASSIKDMGLEKEEKVTVMMPEMI